MDRKGAATPRPAHDPADWMDLPDHHHRDTPAPWGGSLRAAEVLRNPILGRHARWR
jgi:hypothetical protein